MVGGGRRFESVRGRANSLLTGLFRSEQLALRRTCGGIEPFIELSTNRRVACEACPEHGKMCLPGRAMIRPEFKRQEEQPSVKDPAALGEDGLVAVGYHGTSAAAAGAILERGFVASANEYDWLGDGTYFFQDAPLRAYEWALRLHDEPRVLACVITLDGCMDLLDIGWFAFLNEAFDGYLARCKRLGIELPTQTRGAHRLDRAVINYAVDLLAADGFPIRAVRGAFAEGRSAFPQSALLDRSHVQIAARDPTVILDIQDVPASSLPPRRRATDDDT